jgi:hypothetical protein
MNPQLPALVLAVVALLGACAGPSGPSPSPSASPIGSPGTSPGSSPAASGSPAAVDGPERFVADIDAAGEEAREAGEFDASPIAREGLTVCVGEEHVQLYVFATADEAMARARTIDPRDPSNVGTAIVEWAGTPKFWLRDRMLVLYLGTEPETTQLLVKLLGEPFAAGQGRPPLPGPEIC